MVEEIGVLLILNMMECPGKLEDEGNSYTNFMAYNDCYQLLKIWMKYIDSRIKVEKMRVDERKFKNAYEK